MTNRILFVAGSLVGFGFGILFAMAILIKSQTGEIHVSVPVGGYTVTADFSHDQAAQAISNEIRNLPPEAFRRTFLK